MKRALFSGLMALCGVLAAAPGCSTMQSVQNAMLKGEVLTYDQYLSIDQSANPTPTAEMVMKMLGTPLTVHDENGVVRRIDYHAYSLNGDLKTAEFTFDENQKLVKKMLW